MTITATFVSIVFILPPISTNHDALSFRVIVKRAFKAGLTGLNGYNTAMKRLLSLGLSVVLLGAWADRPLWVSRAETITPTDLRAHLEFIASGALEGRDTPSRGLDLAGMYIVHQVSDSVEKIDFGKMARTVFGLAWELADSPEHPARVKLEELQRRR